MNKQYFYLFIFIVFSFPIYSQSSPKNQNAGYEYSIDLTKVENDELLVELKVSKGVTLSNKMIFHFPKIVPGTYKIYDFGRFVLNFNATNLGGYPLKTNRIDANTWEIIDAQKLEKISYYVEDTWDSYQKNTVFEPAGSHFDQNKSFIFNGNTLFGYFENQDESPIKVNITRPEYFTGASNVEPQRGKNDSTDVYLFDSYHELVDNPIMYSELETVTFKVANATIKVVVDIAGDKSKMTHEHAGAYARVLQPLLEAQTQYLGGTLPVNKYTFMIYINDKNYPSKSIGALEHNYCTLICLAPNTPEELEKQVRDIAAHEFLHIVTPLNIHSEIIEKFDFQSPIMSKHLWFYEGVVEYMAQHVQVQSGIISATEFLDIMSQKIKYSNLFDTVAFTEFSQKCLEDEYKSQYVNVYQKGAVIAMCLDLIIIKESEGTRNLASVVRELSEKYGPNRPFKDDSFLSEFGAMTYPKVAAFLESCVNGTSPLPIMKLMPFVGVRYRKIGTKTDISVLGGLDNQQVLTKNKDGRYYIDKAELLDDFGKTDLGLQKGDIVAEWNGKEIDSKNLYSVILGYINKAKKGDIVSVGVIRNGTFIRKSAIIRPVLVNAKDFFEFIDTAGNEQKTLCEQWLGKSWKNR